MDPPKHDGLSPAGRHACGNCKHVTRMDGVCWCAKYDEERIETHHCTSWTDPNPQVYKQGK